MEITCRVYQPRTPRESPLFQLVGRHLEELLQLWPSRFVRSRGPLRPVVERVLREFLHCGLLEHGFARLWCAECRRSVLVAFSCRGRSFCPSCEKKRQLLWAEWLCKDVLAPVSHRHVVLTIPRLLRPLFRRRRELLTELGRAAAEAVTELVPRSLGDDVRPGVVVSIATAGDLVQWHTRCGQRMSLIAFVTDQVSIRRILDHLGLSTPPQDKPPPIRETLRVAEQGESWSVPAEWE